MNESLSYLAWRAVQGVRAQAGELVLVLDHAGREGLAQEIALLLDVAGATPLIEYAPPNYVAQLLAHARPEFLQHFAQHRKEWRQRADKIIVLSSGTLDLDSLPEVALETWSQAQDELTAIEEARRLPNLVVAVPTLERAQQLGLTLEELEAHLDPSIRATLYQLQTQIERVLMAAGQAHSLILRTGDRHELFMRRTGRVWLADDGYIDPSDVAEGAIVSNLPAGSTYTTVIEDATHGTLFLPQVGNARDVVFHFEGGRAVVIEAASGAEDLNAYFDAHEGEPRRISHLGFGLNPFLQKRIGWTIVDEHIIGSLFLAFGENRYMGGQNASTLNVDFDIAGATLFADTRLLMMQGLFVA